MPTIDEQIFQSKRLQELENDRNESMKANIIKLVKDHKDHCHDSECGISLFLVKKLVEKAGFTLTDDEKRYFL